MKYSYTAKKRIRKNFGKLSDVLPIPNLIELQVTSYNQFLERDNLNNQKSGLHKVFESVFPIYDYANNCKLEYTGFRLGKEEYTEEECRITGRVYCIGSLLTIPIMLAEYDSCNLLERYNWFRTA